MYPDPKQAMAEVFYCPKRPQDESNRIEIEEENGGEAKEDENTFFQNADTLFFQNACHPYSWGERTADLLVGRRIMEKYI